MSLPVAVVDVGSNSIKLLVASRAEHGRVVPLFSRTIDARISAGISEEVPRLSEEGMNTGFEAIKSLLADATKYSPAKTVIVATSAVRDAANGHEYRERIRRETGHEVRILTGAEEASYIGRGLTCDPALDGLEDFYVFDLGGGSLECLSFRGRRLEQAESLQLGCVRLTERFLPNVDKPLGRSPRYRIMQHVHDELVGSRFKFTLPSSAVAVGTGGTVATIRSIFAAREGMPFEQVDTYIPLTQMRLLFTRLVRMPLEERRTVPGLPPPRADVFPTALATLIVLADVAAVDGFRHSLYNLRYGIAAEALSES